MNEKEFGSRLAALTQKARRQGFCISEEELRETFPALLENEAQMKLLLDYLKEQHISVGNREEVEEYLSLADKSYLDAYLEGLSGISELPAEEMGRHILAAAKGDNAASSIVVEQFLPQVVSLAKLYTGQGIALEDLIGEGNLALAGGVTLLGCIDTDADLVEEAEGFLGKLMMDAMEALINGELLEKDMDEKMAGRVNRVADAARELAELLRRNVTAQELADNTELTVEEITEAMRASGNRIEDLELPKE